MPVYQYEPGARPIDGYTIQYALGRGGFGEVYFATSDAGREVALKAVQNHEEIELRGIGHCMNLKSRYLVMIFDVKHAEDGTPWVIMEYIAGPSLREILDESPGGIGPDRAAYFLREIAHGLTDLHHAGIVHRDLKPHNVFFESGTTKIGDYSLSKAISISHRSGHTMTVGSVHYMAPEISLGRYDKAVDIYALGVILHEMLTGQPPHVGDSVGEVLMKHLHGKPDLSEIAEPFASVIGKAMQHDPQHRFQTAEEMAAAVFDTESVSAMVDSFNPATLSMIGERPRNRLRQAAAQRHSLDDTFSSPASLRTTQTPPKAPFVAPLKTPDLHSKALDLLPRMALALLSVASLMFIGTLFNGHHHWFAGDLLLLSLLIVSAATAASHFYRWTMPVAPGIPSATARRLLAVVPTIIVLIVFSNLFTKREFEETATLFLGCAVAQLLLDWWCFVSPTRKQRLHPWLTVGSGFIAATVSLAIEQDGNWCVMAAAVTISATVTLQLVSPWTPLPDPTDPSADHSASAGSRMATNNSLTSRSVSPPELQGSTS